MQSRGEGACGETDAAQTRTSDFGAAARAGSGRAAGGSKQRSNEGDVQAAISIGPNRAAVRPRWQCPVQSTVGVRVVAVSMCPPYESRAPPPLLPPTPLPAHCASTVQSPDVVAATRCKAIAGRAVVVHPSPRGPGLLLRSNGSCRSAPLPAAFCALLTCLLACLARPLRLVLPRSFRPLPPLAPAPHPPFSSSQYIILFEPSSPPSLHLNCRFSSAILFAAAQTKTCRHPILLLRTSHTEAGARPPLSSYVRTLRKKTVPFDAQRIIRCTSFI